MKTSSRVSATGSRRLGRTLLASFCATVLFFLLSAAIGQYREREIIHAANNIASDALPAIQHLANARTALREASVLLNSLFRDGPLGSATTERRPEETLAALQRARAVLNQEWHAYRVLPPYRGEQELQANADDALRSLNVSSDEVLARLHTGNEVGARSALITRVAQDTDRFDTQAHTLLDLNAVRAGELCGRIAEVRRESGVLTFLLHALSAVFALLAGFLAFRVVRRFVDVSELRRSELEHFAGRVAHDIRSPLSAVGMSLELAKKDENLEEKSRARLDRGSKTAQRIGQLVDGLLVFAAAGGPPPEGTRAEVQEVLSGVIEGIQESAQDHDIDLHAETIDKGTVACSPGVLTSVLSNLVRNSIKYMGDSAIRKVVVRARDVGAMMRIEVQDSGPGVPPELRQRIFDPYVRAGTTDVSGLGLGLATVRRLVEAHGGSVGVGENRDAGSLFWFQLPKAPESGSERLAGPHSPKHFRSIRRMVQRATH